MTSRRGVSVLALVLMLASIAGIAALAYSDLWRGSSRTLFSVQEHRELANLARSTLSEAHYQLQVKLDRSEREWFDWCTKRRDVPARTLDPLLSKQNAAAMTENPDFVRYEVGEVTVTRVAPIHAGSSADDLGIVDMAVTVRVQRTSPRHEASLRMRQRHHFWLANNPGKYGGGGRHIELSATPAGTNVEDEP